MSPDASTDPDWLRTVSRGHGEHRAGRPWPMAQDDVVTEALRRLIALPHWGAMPAAWEDRAVTLPDVVDLLCALIPANSVGEPTRPGTQDGH